MAGGSFRFEPTSNQIFAVIGPRVSPVRPFVPEPVGVED